MRLPSIVQKLFHCRLSSFHLPSCRKQCSKIPFDKPYIHFQPILSALSNPTLYLNRGQKYNFVLAAASEPFYIKTAASTGTGDQYTKGVTGNGIQFGTVTFTPTMDADSALFYQSSVTGAYGGSIKVIT